jgi:hypothetical protein
MNELSYLQTTSGNTAVMIAPNALTMSFPTGEVVLQVGTYTYINGVQYRCLYSDHAQTVFERV